MFFSGDKMKKQLLVFTFAIIYTFIFTAFASAGPMTNLLTNPSAENGITGWTIVSGNWQACDNTSWHPVRTGSYYFFPGVADYPEMYQEIDLTSLAADIDNGIVCGIGQAFVGSYANSDDCKVIIEYKNANGTVISSEDSGWVTGPTTSWTQVDLPAYPGVILPVSTRTIRFRILGKRDAGSDCDSYFEDLSWMYRIVLPDNNSPSVPVISGPTQTDTGVAQNYSFTANDIDGDNLSYQIDWGDGQVSDWSGYIAPAIAYNTSHSWTTAGINNIKARSRDEQGAVSDWSENYVVTVTGQVSGSFTYGPYLQNVTTDAITIMWVTDNMVTPFIAYSSDDSYANGEYGTCVAESSVYICKVRLTALDTETTYNYIAYSGTTEAAPQTFTTAPYKSTSFGFCVWGDSQQEVTPSNAIFTGMVNNNTDFGLCAGDIVQNTDWTYTQSPFLKYTLNKLAKVKPVFIGYGNHDGSVSSMPRKFTEQPTTTNYAFTYGNAHFTVLDYATGYTSSVPVTWLKSVLGSQEAQSATWRFFVIHVPPYCERWIDGNAVLRASLVPLLEQYGVDMIFSGHTHEYERGYLNGVNYIVSGCASYLDTIEPIIRDWEFITVGGSHNIPPFTGGLAHGYTEIQINGNNLELKQHAYYPNGTYYGIMDSISITKDFADCDFNFDGKIDYADLDYIANDWTAKPLVDVYLGQDFNDVNDATPSSPVYIGNFASNSYQPGSLELDKTYYWRMDEIDANGPHKGNVWQFTAGSGDSNLGWWKLDGKTEDSSSNNNDAVALGNISTKTDHNWAKSFYFDGTNDYLQIPNESTFDLTTQVTIAAWIRLDTSEEGLYTIASKGNEFWLYIDNYAKANIFYFEGFGRPVESLSDIGDGQWHHIVAVYDGTERAIYIDGIKDASWPTTGSIGLNNEPLQIGNNELNEEINKFKGMIREFRIYSDRLSDDQILWLSKTDNYSPQPFNGQNNVSLGSPLIFSPRYWMENKKTDLNKDFVIDFGDFSIFADQWQK